MLILLNDTCEHCGESNRTLFGFDELSLFCCLGCELALSRSALPYYEFAECEEMQLARISTLRGRLIGLMEKAKKRQSELEERRANLFKIGDTIPFTDKYTGDAFEGEVYDIRTTDSRGNVLSKMDTIYLMHIVGNSGIVASRSHRQLIEDKSRKFIEVS